MMKTLNEKDCLKKYISVDEYEQKMDTTQCFHTENESPPDHTHKNVHLREQMEALIRLSSQIYDCETCNNL